ncbi:MAG: UDP-N-acetylglucosamine 1-carboxyvinyltransferase [Clostridiales bacterium]|nr:UDP-N-acetylglucosamine 1-carboxyvinyltransferase [Clostridiales bacterium]
MDSFIIEGQKSLNGYIRLHGAKNSALPILASTILIHGVSVIHNCPDLSDVNETVKILESLGCKVARSGSTITVDATTVNSSSIDEQAMRSMRSSIIFLGALMSRATCASIYFPGGCDIGARPVDLHLKALKSLGAVINENGSSIECCAQKIIGGKIILPIPSVGATENIIIAAAVSKGRTTIINPAREPEISDLAGFLNNCGARIFGAGETTIEIEGVERLTPCEYTIIPDRILASTYMSACAITGGEIVIEDVLPTHLSPIFPAFNEMGCKLYLSGNILKICAPKHLKRVRSIKTMPYPGFPTDSQSPIVAALSVAKGTSVIKETVFENRFRYVSELRRFGADIDINEQLAVINGVKKLHSANVNATDLRGGAALVVAALAAEGESTVNYVNHIDRGYENLELALSSLGGAVKRIYNEKD